MPTLKYLNQKHYEAMEKKMRGESYRKIAGDLGSTIDTIKSWFRPDGILREHYDRYNQTVYERFYQNARPGTMTHEIVQNILKDANRQAKQEIIGQPVTQKVEN